MKTLKTLSLSSIALLILTSSCLMPMTTAAQEEAAMVVDDTPIEVEFEALSELGELAKPTVKMASTQAAFDFIMADTFVREAVEAKKEQGYADWKATSKLMGYDGNEPVYEVRVSASNQMPPYVCVYRFDSIGNDRRERPWTGCKYE